MAGNGVKSTEVDQVSTVDDLLGNKDGSSGRIVIDNLANQLVGSGPLAARFNDVESQILSGLIPAASWAGLLTLSPSVDEQGAEVPDSDGGTHAQATATGYDGATVPNAGRFRWNLSWGRWVWVTGTGLSAKANTADLGTAASEDVGAFATAAQGAKADTALQPADATSFASAAQGAKADTALQPSDAGSFASAAQGELMDALGATVTRQDTRAELQAAFSSALTGADRAKIAIGAAANNSDLGAVWRLDGAEASGGFQDIAPRREIAVEAGRVYRVRVSFVRSTDPADPSGHTIELRMQNLTAARANLSNVQVHDFGAVAVADGVQTHEVIFSRDAGQEYQNPATTRYALPYLRVYGGDHQTDVALIELADITDLAATNATLASQATSISGNTAAAGTNAAAAAANATAISTHTARVDNPHGVTKEQIGLGDAPNVPAADLRDRATHTGTQAPQTVTSLVSTLVKIATDLSGVNGRQDAPITLEGGAHPWSSLIPELVYALADGDGNFGLGVDVDGDLWAHVIRVLGGIVAETFEVNRDGSEYAFAIVDANDHLGFAITHLATALLGGAVEIGGESDWDIAVIDSDDNVGWGIKGGVVYAPGQSLDQGGIADLDRRNKAFSESIAQTAIQGVQLPTAVYNGIICYGQSLAEGNQSFPSLSKTPEPGALMVGDNVDNVNTADTYGIIGTLQFNPLVAYTNNGTVNLTGAEEDALNPGSQHKGEPPVIGLTNGLKRYMNRRALAEDDGRNLVAMSPAIGGKTIEELSKGELNTVDEVDRYSIVTDGIDKLVTLAGADTCVVSAFLFMQGEFNYNNHGGTRLRDEYAALQRAMFDNLTEDTMSRTGQALPPLFLTYQTGASYTRDEDENGDPGLHVGMAQMDVDLERDGVVMVGPIYPYPDRGGHLSSNGSRWFGHMAAKVARKVLLEGQDWQPIRPIEIQQTDKTILISYHVPVPPLVFGPTYVVATPTEYDDKGFRVTSADGETEYTILDVSIVADTVVQITLASAPPSDALVWYADYTNHFGNGNLRDSDRSVAIDTYEYVPDRGAYAEDDIPELVDKAYSLENWSSAFCRPITYTEF